MFSACSMEEWSKNKLFRFSYVWHQFPYFLFTILGLFTILNKEREILKNNSREIGEQKNDDNLVFFSNTFWRFNALKSLWSKAATCHNGQRSVTEAQTSSKKLMREAITNG